VLAGHFLGTSRIAVLPIFSISYAIRSHPEPPLPFSAFLCLITQELHRAPSVGNTHIGRSGPDPQADVLSSPLAPKRRLSMRERGLFGRGPGRLDCKIRTRL
jgi:hypothetical protein